MTDTLRGIGFMAEMLGAIDAGVKSQTRRIITPQPDLRTGEYGDTLSFKNRNCFVFLRQNAAAAVMLGCPIGATGDVLYCKEGLKRSDDGTVAYASDGRPALADGILLHWPWKVKTLPSIFMPKRYARRWIRLTSVRVERLNEISEADAMAEGIQVGHYYRDEAALENDDHGDHDDIGTHRCMSAREDFRILWESIHGPGSFDSRWVWVLGFERVI